MAIIEIKWPNGKSSLAESGSDWLSLSKEVGVNIPTGCLGGSCGACEIEVNGKIVRACISTVPEEKSGKLKIEFCLDPFW